MICTGFRIQNDKKIPIYLQKNVQIRAYTTKTISLISENFSRADKIYICDDKNNSLIIYPTPTISISRLDLLHNKSPLLVKSRGNDNKIRLKNTTSCKVTFENIKIRDSTDRINQKRPSVLLEPNGSFDLTINNYDKELNMRLFDMYGNWVQIEGEEEKILTLSKGSQTPSQWIVGSLVEIWSQTYQSWNNGTIINISNDKEGEWLTVEYEAGYKLTTKQVSRNDSTIIRSRPSKKRSMSLI